MKCPYKKETIEFYETECEGEMEELTTIPDERYGIGAIKQFFQCLDCKRILII